MKEYVALKTAREMAARDDDVIRAYCERETKRLRGELSHVDHFKEENEMTLEEEIAREMCADQDEMTMDDRAFAELCASVIDWRWQRPDIPDAYAENPPEWAKDTFNHDAAATCGFCGAWMSVVRPGKVQCDYCGDSEGPLAKAYTIIEWTRERLSEKDTP